jgi:hypothetical protein
MLPSLMLQKIISNNIKKNFRLKNIIPFMAHTI